jgi:hypothetical protein
MQPVEIDTGTNDLLASLNECFDINVEPTGSEERDVAPYGRSFE